MYVPRFLRRVAFHAAWFVLLLAGSAGASALDAPPRMVAVLYSETTAPYRQLFAEILGGIEQGLPTETVRPYALPASPDVAIVRRWLDQQAPDTVVTLGRVATETYEKIDLKIPQVIGALDASPQTRPNVVGVSLDVDPALLFATLRQLAPEKQRVWVVFDPAYDRWLIDLAQTAAHESGLKLQPLEASDSYTAIRHFLRVFETADPATDVLWLMADAKLVDPEAVLPVLIEKSWQRRLILFSNSLQHVHRGVLFALYPDNNRLGRRLAELSLQVPRASNAKSGIEPLRAVKRAINLKMAAHLELNVSQDTERQFDLVLPPW